jgi:hypothetical protein
MAKTSGQEGEHMENMRETHELNVDVCTEGCSWVVSDFNGQSET